jgi:signal transduction histidine kinase
VDDHRGSATENHLTVDFAGEPAPVVTDPRRARQVLGNLLSNAIKYTPPGGVIRVRVVHEQTGKAVPRVGVRVEDNGPGVPPELRARLFDEFFRVSAGESAAHGTGLGLAIARKIAHLLGGDVTFQPAEPHGAVFTFWLEGK